MSFGFSVGDFVAVPTLAWQLYKACKDSSDDFKDVADAVASMHIVLKETAEYISSSSLDQAQQGRLNTVGEGCRNVLRDLEALLEKYKSLGTQSQRTWDRMRWGLEDVTNLKVRLQNSTAMLTALNTAITNSSQARVERKLDQLLTEMRAGKRERSVVSTTTIESLSTDDEAAWHKLQKELEDADIPLPTFIQHRSFIVTWFKSAIATGAFEEDAPSPPEETGIHVSGQKNDIVDQGTPAPSIAISNLPSNVTGDITASKKSQRRRSVFTRAFGNRKGLTQKPDLPVDPQLTAEESSGDQTPASLTVGAGHTEIAEPGEGAVALSSTLQGDILEHLSTVSSVSSLTQEDELRPSIEPASLTNPGDVFLSQTRFNLLASPISATFQILPMPPEDITILSYGDPFRELNKKFREAVTICNFESVKVLLNAGADLDCKDESSATAMHDAASYGSFPMISFLLNYSPNLKIKDDAGRTALHVAVCCQQELIIRTLLPKIPPSNEDVWNSTILHSAVIYDDYNITRLLLQHGANIQIRSKRIVLSMTKSARKILVRPKLLGMPSTTRLDFLVVGARISYKPSSGELVETESFEIAQVLSSVEEDSCIYIDTKHASSALQIAVQSSSIHMVSLLLQYGANAQDVDAEQSPILHAAVGVADTSILQLLLHHGADINQLNERGSTGLHIAAWFGRKEVAQWLLDEGANIEARDKYYRTPLHEAVYCDGAAVVQVLLSAGADINAEDRRGETPLHYAVNFGFIGLLALLVTKGADVTASDTDMRTPLHRAIQTENLDVIQFLISNGANIDAQNHEGYTALHDAIIIGNKDLVKVLLDAGADTTVQNFLSQTPSHIATAKGNEGIVELLSNAELAREKSRAHLKPVSLEECAV
ncbi:hypothetical protein MMC11_001603 [Xylographa trunciseda]|nr:hypothetical protein [Xylographa trunciseda]